MAGPLRFFLTVEMPAFASGGDAFGGVDFEVKERGALPDDKADAAAEAAAASRLLPTSEVRMM